MRPLRVLHVIPTFADSYGGPVTACRGLCTELARRGLDVSILTTTWDGRRAVAPEELRVPDGVRLQSFAARPPRSWWYSPELARALAEGVEDQDVVHVHMLYAFPPNAAAAWSRRRGIPYVVQPHGCLHPWVRHRHRPRKRVHEWLFERRTVRRAAAVVYTAEEERRLSTGFVKVPEVVIPLGIDVPEDLAGDPRLELERRWPALRGRKVVLFLGRLHEKKGLDLLIRGFAPIARSRSDVALMIVGPDDGLGPRLKEWLRRAGVADKTVLTGMLQGADKLAAFRGATLFALTSQAENFALAVAEAMAHGVPVVISDQINIWREVDSAEAGIVVPLRDDAVENALERLLGDDELSRRLGANGRNLVARVFRWRDVGERMVELYSSAVKAAEPS